MIRSVRFVMAAALLAPLAVLSPAGTASAGDPAVASTGLTLTLSLDWFERFEVPDSGIGEEGEFFPEIRIGDGPVQRGRVVSDDKFHPKNLSPGPWVFTQALNLPDDQRIVPVMIRIWDEDGGLNFGDDRMDVSPQNRDVELNVDYDIAADSWSGESVPRGWPCVDSSGQPQGQGCAIGEGDPNFPEDGDGKPVALGFSITSSNHSDADQDGHTDIAERHGIRNKDGSMVVDLPRFGANPLRKDIFVELDYTTGRSPSHLDVEAVKRAFALAPVPNPGGPDGINLWIDSGGLHDPNAMEGPPAGTCNDGQDNDGLNGRDGADPDCYYRDVGIENPVPNCNDGTDNDLDGRADRDDADCLVGDNFGGGNTVPALDNCGFDSKFFQTKLAPGNHFTAGRDKAFHYVVYTTSDPDTDGAGPDPGCGIGGQGSGTDMILYRTDGGALMHELGHNLALDHGGNEPDNCKPNYVSLLNYDINSGIPRAGGGLILDYSPARVTLDGSRRGRAPLDVLKENDLYENRVLDSTDDANNFVFLDDRGVKRLTPLNANPDWNGDNPTGFGDDGGQRFEVNIDGAGPADCANDTKNSELTGHNDWQLVQARLPQRFPSSGGGKTEPHTFPTAEEAARIRAAYNTADVGVTIAATPEPVAAGQTLTWTLTASNRGPNPATSTEVVTTLPADVTYTGASTGCVTAARTVRCNLDELRAGTSKQYTIRAAVPADVVHRNGGPKVISATATVDNLAGPDPNPANDVASAQTTVIAVADLAVTKVADRPSGTANDPVQYTITVSSAGPSYADGVRLTDDLPDSAEGAFEGATASDGGTCTLAASGDLSCTWPTTLLPGGSRTVTVATRITDDGVAASLLDTASAAFAGTDPAAANDSASVTTQIVKAPTTMTARPALAELRFVPGLGLQLYIGELSARLTRADNGRPVVGRELRFVTNSGHHLCTARTDADGYAICRGVVTSLLTVVSLGYRVSSTEDGRYLASTASAPLIRIN